ncbi:hypothetical protein EJ08DRAFT_682732 [Tothia fuscella]|uniref:Uncharacterized protein n=1 Tax=Tothia fuscella TaxID=1048955 RepID=A0A9P4NID1_9PEZI|nr:hypothetical protein EJ08DRAFT_682732 [Tothia fuscella]
MLRLVGLESPLEIEKISLPEPFIPIDEPTPQSPVQESLKDEAPAYSARNFQCLSDLGIIQRMRKIDTIFSDPIQPDASQSEVLGMMRASLRMELVRREDEHNKRIRENLRMSSNPTTDGHVFKKAKMSLEAEASSANQWNKVEGLLNVDILNMSDFALQFHIYKLGCAVTDSQSIVSIAMATAKERLSSLQEVEDSYSVAWIEQERRKNIKHEKRDVEAELASEFRTSDKAEGIEAEAEAEEACEVRPSDQGDRIEAPADVAYEVWTTDSSEWTLSDNTPGGEVKDDIEDDYVWVDGGEGEKEE